jgi:hypothetical protein
VPARKILFDMGSPLGRRKHRYPLEKRVEGSGLSKREGQRKNHGMEHGVSLSEVVTL